MTDCTSELQDWLADMDAEKEHRRQRREAIKTQKALTQPPRLGKLKYEKAPVQVSRNHLQQHQENVCWPCRCKATMQDFECGVLGQKGVMACAGLIVFRGHRQFEETQGSSHAGKGQIQEPPEEWHH